MADEPVYFEEIDRMQEEIIQYAGKTESESETRKEEGWN